MFRLSQLLLGLLLVAVAAAAKPSAIKDVVFKPTFLTGYDSLTAGTGFILELDGRFVFVTAHHLFGPAAGLEADLSPEQAQDFAAAVAVSSMDDPKRVLTSSQMLLISSARAFNANDAGKDVAGFLLSAYKGPALRVSSETPKIGDAVYLFARPRGEETLRIVSGRVTKINASLIEYVYEDGRINFAGTSGAPVLDESGRVVAINLGGGELKGKTYGFGNPSASFMRLLGGALGPAK